MHEWNTKYNPYGCCVMALLTGLRFVYILCIDQVYIYIYIFVCGHIIKYFSFIVWSGRQAIVIHSLHQIDNKESNRASIHQHISYSLCMFLEFHFPLISYIYVISLSNKNLINMNYILIPFEWIYSQNNNYVIFNDLTQ